MDEKLKAQLLSELACFPRELRRRFQEDREAMIEDERYYERQGNIQIAAEALVDAGISDEVVVRQLQRFWDLRQSEALYFVRVAHKNLSQNPETGELS